MSQTTLPLSSGVTFRLLLKYDSLPKRLTGLVGVDSDTIVDDELLIDLDGVS